MTLNDGRWHAGIGDPDATGWITVLAYTVAMVFCYACHRKAHQGGHRQFWFAMAIIMALLGVNKQLDLQTWFTQWGRDLALEYGWYQRRRLVQGLFIAWLILAGLLAQSWLRQWLKSLDVYARRAGVGLVLLGAFVVIRATSFHHVDQMLGFTLASIRVNVILELTGIAVIVWAARGRLKAPVVNATRLSPLGQPLQRTPSAPRRSRE